jgi:hypothetical protein
MAAKKKTGSMGSGSSGSSNNKNKTPGSMIQAAPGRKPATGRAPGTSMPTPAAAARRDFMTGGTGQGSGRTTYNRDSSWNAQYKLELSRLKRNATTTSGQGSGRSKMNGSEGPKRPKPRLPKTK